MRSLYSCLLACFVCLNIINNCHGYSLSLVLPAKIVDCFYYPREIGNRILVDMQVREGESVDFNLFDPDGKLMQQRLGMIDLSIEREVEKAGDYAFCFHNRHYMQSAVLEFDYEENSADEEESRLHKKLIEEKRALIKQVLSRKPQEHLELDKEDDVPSNDTMEELEHKLIVISINLDRVSAYITRSKSKMAYHYYLVDSNLSYVNYSSIGISLAIVVMGMLQVIVLKGLFNGKMNFKVWQF